MDNSEKPLSRPVNGYSKVSFKMPPHELSKESKSQSPKLIKVVSANNGGCVFASDGKRSPPRSPRLESRSLAASSQTDSHLTAGLFDNAKATRAPNLTKSMQVLHSKLV